jgi:hypothetical protein
MSILPSALLHANLLPNPQHMSLAIFAKGLFLLFLTPVVLVVAIIVVCLVGVLALFLVRNVKFSRKRIVAESTKLVSI